MTIDALGDAATARKLFAPFNINGVATDGSEDVTIPATATVALYSIGNSGTSKTLDLANGLVQSTTLTNNCTFGMPTAVAGASFTLMVFTGAGSFTGTFSNVKWIGSAPTITTAAAKLDIFRFRSDGTDWYGIVEGQGYTPTVGGTHLTDSFTAANSSSSAGANWTNRNGIVGIISNQAYPATATFIHCLASHNTTMTNNDMSVSWTVGALVGSGLDFTDLIIGANAAGESVMAAYQGDTTVRIYTKNAWSGTDTFQNYAIVGSLTPGDVHTFSRVGNVYTISKNGTPLTMNGGGTTWTDSGNIVPRDSSHRYVGFGGINNSGNYRTVDAWAADSA